MNFISSFSSIKLNKRTDEYGGNEENSSRLFVEIVKKIKEAIGNDMIIAAKIDSTDEENGYTVTEFGHYRQCSVCGKKEKVMDDRVLHDPHYDIGG